MTLKQKDPRQIYTSRVEYINFNLAIMERWNVNLSAAASTF